MGPFFLSHVAFVGFFLCSALYATWTWWFSRGQRVLLIFATQCVLCALLSASFAMVATADTPAVAGEALRVRFVAGLLAMAVTAVLSSRITGLRARWYVRTVTSALAAACVFYLLVDVRPGTTLVLHGITLPWGETLTIPSWSPVPRWFGGLVATVTSVNVFVVLGAIHLFRTDRTGGILVGLGGATGLVNTAFSAAADFGWVMLPYMGDIPFAFWVVTIATQLARQNEQVRQGAITDRQRAEEAARASSRRLALAISATSDAVWEWNYQAGDTYYSPRWYEMLGAPADLPMHVDSFKSLCHPDDLAPAFAAIDDALNRPESNGYEVEFRMRHGSGTWIWVLVRGNTVERDAWGRPLIVAGTNTDITQRKEAEARRRELEARLAQSHRMESMGRLAGGIAHDFNNILTVINGYSDLLIGTGTLPTPEQEMLTEIRNAGERAAALTRQLLTFSRHQVVAPDTHELNLVVTDTQRMLERLIGEHITLRTELAPDLLWVRADAGQLSQVIVNLAVNARDAMPEGGTLTVSTSRVDLDPASAATIAHGSRAGSFAVLCVADTGTGIPRELQELVFEPFFTTKGPGRGTGLGLTTVQGIVEQCGGMLTMESSAGTGSKFSVYLPMASAPGETEAAQPAHEAGSQGRRTVLMVEDEASVRHVVQVMLERLGMQVLAATDAQAALETVRRHVGPIDLLLTDIIMPGVNGRQLAEQVQALRPTIRTVYMSGYTDDAIVQQVVLHADAFYLQKPFDADTLHRILQQAFDSTPPSAA